MVRTKYEETDEKKQRACWEWNGDKIQENVANLPSHSIQSYRLNSNVARYHRIQISFELLCTVRTYVCYVLPYEYAYYHTIAVTSSHFLFLFSILFMFHTSNNSVPHITHTLHAFLVSTRRERVLSAFYYYPNNNLQMDTVERVVDCC